MSRFKKKLVLITGASSGVGEACARGFAAEGASLVLWARRLPRLQRIQRDLEERHGVVVRIDQVDVRERERVLAVARDLAAEGAVPDVLVNNAGLASGLDNIH